MQGRWWRVWITVPAVISCIVWRLFSSLPVWVADDLCGGLYIQSLGRDSHRTGWNSSTQHSSPVTTSLATCSWNNTKQPIWRKMTPSLQKKRENNLSVFVWEKVNKSEIHSEAQNSSKQNRVLQSPRLRSRQRGEVWDKEWATLGTRKTLSTHSPGLNRQ